ncbi:unnamed protein product [Amoebophrya sp. A120]|nr:unnamed protein product [Amoebophrya sp. A120]|eukprot:GSA120T00013151001.1
MLVAAPPGYRAPYAIQISRTCTTCITNFKNLERSQSSKIWVDTTFASPRHSLLLTTIGLEMGPASEQAPTETTFADRWTVYTIAPRPEKKEGVSSTTRPGVVNAPSRNDLAPPLQSSGQEDPAIGVATAARVAQAVGRDDAGPAASAAEVFATPSSSSQMPTLPSHHGPMG